jgi:hypothetical protein
MRRILVLLAAAVVVGGFTASSTSAAPSDIKVSVGGQAKLVSPSTLELPVTYNCPESFGPVPGGLSGSVQQASTGAAGDGFEAVPCTGKATTVVVTINAVNGKTFQLGQALAKARLGVWEEAVEQTRRIQIVE